MSMVSISRGSGPGSAMPLSAETIKVRDKVIERFIDKSLEELTSFLENALQVEKDEDRRLGLLAARIYILRHRVEHIKEYNRDPSVEPMGVPTPRSMLSGPEQAKSADTPESDTIDDANSATMKEVKTIEAGEINGVRIPAGIIIMVNQEDAERMIANGKAIYIIKDENGNIIEQPVETPDSPAPEMAPADAPVIEGSRQDGQEYISGDTGSGIDGNSTPADAADMAGDTENADALAGQADASTDEAPAPDDSAEQPEASADGAEAGDIAAQDDDRQDMPEDASQSAPEEAPEEDTEDSQKAPETEDGNQSPV